MCNMWFVMSPCCSHGLAGTPPCGSCCHPFRDVVKLAAFEACPIMKVFQCDILAKATSEL